MKQSEPELEEECEEDHEEDKEASKKKTYEKVYMYTFKLLMGSSITRGRKETWIRWIAVWVGDWV